MKKIENFIKCDFCGSRTNTNMQKIWVKFNVNKKGEYKEDKDFSCFDIEEPINDDNLHFCKKDFKRWLNGQI